MSYSGSLLPSGGNQGTDRKHSGGGIQGISGNEY